VLDKDIFLMLFCNDQIVKCCYKIYQNVNYLNCSFKLEILNIKNFIKIKL